LGSGRALVRPGTALVGPGAAFVVRAGDVVRWVGRARGDALRVDGVGSTGGWLIVVGDEVTGVGLAAALLSCGGAAASATTAAADPPIAATTAAVETIRHLRTVVSVSARPIAPGQRVGASGKLPRMVLEVATFDVTPGQEDEFTAAYQRVKHLLTSTAGCRSARMTRGIESPSQFILIVEWDTVEAHVQGFRGSDRFPSWRAAISPYFAGSPHAEHYADVQPAGTSGRRR
jgi:heme-degrading monooxygenase HmoA